MGLKDYKILVTGAGGFIGSHLTEELVGRGCRVRAFIRYNSQNSWGWLDYSTPDILNKLEVFCGDIRDPHGVKEAMKDCELVIHLAALIAIPYSYHSPASYVDTNIKGTLNVLQAARDLGVEKVVHTSTSEVYGSARRVPIDENHPLQGQSPYSASKIAADQLALSFFYSFNTPVSIIRPFNTYGPRQSARAVIPTIISQAARDKGEIKLGAVSPTRDFSYIKDMVRGFIAVAESNVSVGEVINIGSGHEISIKDLAHLIAQVMGTSFKIETDYIRLRPDKSEVDRLLADNSRAKTILRWEPRYRGPEGLKKGLQETAEWFCNQNNLDKYGREMYTL